MNLTSRHGNFIKHCTFLNEHFDVITYFPGDKKVYLISHVLLCIVNSTMIFPALVLNCLSAMTILKNSQLKEKACYFLIEVQSLVDAAIGIFAQPLIVFAIASEIYGSPTCTAHFLVFKLTYFFTSLSVIALCAMTLERYLGIFHPLFHRSNLTNTRLLLGMSCGTLWPLISLTLSTIYPKFYRITSSIAIALFLPLVACVYTKIWLSMRSRRQMIARGVHCITQPSNINDRQKTEKEMKMAKSCFLVVVCSVVCLLPISFNATYQTLDIFRSRVGYLWSLTFLMSNSILNSLIFFWRNPLLVKCALSLKCSTIIK